MYVLGSQWYWYTDSHSMGVPYLLPWLAWIMIECESVTVSSMSSHRHSHSDFGNRGLDSSTFYLICFPGRALNFFLVDVCYIQHCMDLQLAVDPYKRHVLFESIDWLPKTCTKSVDIFLQIKYQPNIHQQRRYVMRSEDCNFHRNQTFGRRIDRLFVYFWTSEMGYFDS